MTQKQRELAAKALVEAAVNGDKAGCKVGRCGKRTLQRYRKAVADGTDPELSRLVAALRSKVEETWVEGVVKQRADDVLEKVYGFLERACEGDHKDPKMVEAIVKAGEFLNETLTVGRMMHSVQSPRTSPANRAEARPMGGVAGGARATAGAGRGDGAPGTGTSGTTPVH